MNIAPRCWQVEPPEKVTTATWLRQWLDDNAVVKVRVTTLRRYRGIIEHHLIPAHRPDPAHQVPG